MATVIYRAPEGDDMSVNMLGYDFFDGEPVEVSDAAHVAKFKENRFFDVADVEIEAVEVEPASVELPKRGPGRPRKVMTDADPSADEKEGGV